MTVADLIEALKKLPQDLHVNIPYAKYSDYHADIMGVEAGRITGDARAYYGDSYEDYLSELEDPEDDDTEPCVVLW